MARNLIEKLAIPGVAAACVAGAALAATGPAPAYGDALARIDAETAGANAAYVFERADLDGSGDLDAREYAALSIVTAELARLNGFISVVEGDGAPRTAALPEGAARAMSPAERARVEAVAAREYHEVAGADGAVSKAAFVEAEMERFAAADRNRNGALRGAELDRFVQLTARLPQSGA